MPCRRALTVASILLVLALVTGLPAPAVAEDWPAWRGPTATGIAAAAVDPPTRWGVAENVRWKLALPEPGNSTPIVWKERIFLTQATDKGKDRGLWCVSRKDGSVFWKKTVRFDGDEPTHGDNPYCAASPATDGSVVVAFHGSAGIHAYGLDGSKVWQRDVGPLRHIWGNASSPVLSGDRVYVSCGPGPRTFLLALDRRDGSELWKVEIPGGLEDGGGDKWTGSWSTPFVLPDAGGEQVLMSFPYKLQAFDGKTGAEVWHCGGLGRLVYTSPVARDGVVASFSGYMGPSMAVRLGGKGDVTATHRLWRRERAPQQIGTGVIAGGHLYLVNDAGAGECIELESGKTVWMERIGGQTWSSPVLAEDKIYSIDKNGQCTVFRAAPTHEVIARSELNETTRASVVIADGEVLIRTYNHLWSIGNP